MKTKNLQYLVTSATRHLKEAKVTFSLISSHFTFYMFNDFESFLFFYVLWRKAERLESSQQIKQLKLQLSSERQKKLQAQKTQKQMIATLRKIRVRLHNNTLLCDFMHPLYLRKFGG